MLESGGEEVAARVLYASNPIAASFSKIAMELKVGYVCDRGLNPKRPVNQDRFLSVPERGLFAVFDGVGGQRAGEVASQTAAETIEEALANSSAGSSVELVSRAIQFANRDIFELAESEAAYKTMATTVALVHIESGHATIAHVGDSRVYRLEDGRFYRETIDHTDFNDAMKAGLAARSVDSGHGRSNIINRALGVDREVEVDVKQVNLRDGARFLLCSDGIYRHLSDEEIARILAENRDTQHAADELKRLVHERGADDNLTAVVVQAGRARTSPVLAIENPNSEPRTDRSRASRATAGSAPPVPDRRIRVEFGESREQGSSISREANSSRKAAAFAEDPASSSRWLMYVMVILVLLSASFYAGLRVSDWRNTPTLEANSTVNIDELKSGREAFERGDYAAALNEFESVVKRDPQKATALYWLGRARLEQKDYSGAARDFEETTRRDPRLLDAYVQAAASYQAMGDKGKAAEMLTRYADERRKGER